MNSDTDVAISFGCSARHPDTHTTVGQQFGLSSPGQSLGKSGLGSPVKLPGMCLLAVGTHQ